MVRFGLLGAGRIGQVHGRNIAASGRAKLVALADPDRAAAERLASATGAALRDPDAILKATDVDAVLIATPTDTHADLIEAAAAAGKAILCEKPVSLSVERIETCLAAVARAGVPLMIGFHRRYDPNFASLERRLRAGEIGDIEIVTICCRDPAPPPVSYITRSGGIFRDMTIHDFDMARFLLAEEPVVIHALGSVLVDPAIGKAGDVDTAAVHMQTASRQDLRHITGSRRATYGHDQRIEVHRIEGAAPGRQRPRDDGRACRRARLRGATSFPSPSSSGTRKPTAASSTRSSMRWKKASARVPTAATASWPRSLPMPPRCRGRPAMPVKVA